MNFRHALRHLPGQFSHLLTWQMMLFVAWLILFTLLRVINLDGTLLWVDDILTLPTLDVVPWSDLPDVIRARLARITGPVFPTVLSGIIINTLGLSVIALRLPALLASLVGVLLLRRALQLLFPQQIWAQWVPLILYTFSVPAIIYAQQIQPTAYYLLGSCAQLVVFISFYRTGYHEPMFRRRMLTFITVSTVVFFINYLSVLMTGLLSAFWAIRLFDETYIGKKQRSLRTTVGRFGLFLGLHIPLFILIFNVPYEGPPGRSYFYRNYFLSLQDFVIYSYDLITYHLNYAFDELLYYPLTSNPLSSIFVIAVLIGAIRFLRRHRLHIIYAVFSLLIIYFAARLSVYPYGGLRHSFTLAPLLYIFIGYTVQGLSDYSRLRQVGSVSLVGFATLTWLFSGINLYADRDQQLRGERVVQIATEQGVDTVIAHDDAYGVLRFQQVDDAVNILRFGGETDLAEVAIAEPFILVGMTTAINPDWDTPLGLIPPEIVCEACPYKITPIIEDNGPLPYDRDHIVQSIYWPLNGMFVYIVNPTLANQEIELDRN